MSYELFKAGFIHFFVLLGLIVSLAKLVGLIKQKLAGETIRHLRIIGVSVSLVIFSTTAMALHFLNKYSVWAVTDLKETHAALMNHIKYTKQGCDECKIKVIEAANKGHPMSAILGVKGGYYTQDSADDIINNYPVHGKFDVLFGSPIVYYYPAPVNYSLHYFILENANDIAVGVEEMSATIFTGFAEQKKTDDS